MNDLLYCADVCIFTCRCGIHGHCEITKLTCLVIYLQSALHAAAVDNKLLFTELLLDHGADVEALDAGGLRPIDLATKNKCNDCITAITNKLGLSSIILSLSGGIALTHFSVVRSVCLSVTFMHLA